MEISITIAWQIRTLPSGSKCFCALPILPGIHPWIIEQIIKLGGILKSLQFHKLQKPHGAQKAEQEMDVYNGKNASCLENPCKEKQSVGNIKRNAHQLDTLAFLLSFIIPGNVPSLVEELLAVFLHLPGVCLLTIWPLLGSTSLLHPSYQSFPRPQHSYWLKSTQLPTACQPHFLPQWPKNLGLFCLSFLPVTGLFYFHQAHYRQESSSCILNS